LLIDQELTFAAWCFLVGRKTSSGVAMLGTILLIILILILIGALPRWPYSSGWGYYPSGGLGLILLIVIILLLAGRI
jgi:uncharacterized protein DUF3309